MVLIIAIIYSGVFYLRHPSWQMLLAFVIGTAVSMIGYWADEAWFKKYYQDAQQSVGAITHSLWLLVLYWPLAIFIVTSTGSWIGLGIFFGLGLVLSADIFRFRNSGEELKQYFKFPPQSKLTADEIKIASWVWLIAFGAISLLKLI